MTFAQPFKDYEILDRVGAGAMGTVFKARHKKLGRIVALKVLKPSLARDERYVDRLKREARIVASLNHPNIVTGYDLGEEGGYHYFVMEFVEGKSLRALLTEWGMFSEEKVLEIASQVAVALDHAWQRGVIHRDVKPGNILIDERGVVKLTDMGLAKGPADLTLTRDGGTVGTPQYISPEQARAPQDVDVRSDLYSLGATLYHMATGQPPFHGATMAEVIMHVLQSVPPSPRELNPALSEGMSLVIRKLLAKDLRVRYQTPRELLDDLALLERDQPPRVDESRLVRAEIGPQPSVWLRSLAIVGVAGVLTLAVWFGSRLRADDHRVLPPDEMVALLERELPALPSAYARLQRLREVRAAQTLPLAQLTPFERRVSTELQKGVDEVAQELQGNAWKGVETWLRDPARWPGAADFERERVQEALLRRLGCQREQLPADVSAGALNVLLRTVTDGIARRDDDLLRQLDTWLTITLPGVVERRLEAGDFAAADRAWQTGLTEFFDGVRQPRLERVAVEKAQQARLRHQRVQQEAVARIDALEVRAVAALRDEVAGIVRLVEQRLAAGADPEQVAAFARLWREQLAASWPPSARFRADQDPWPQLDGMAADLERRLAIARAQQLTARQDLRIELAWRVLCSGSPADALQFLTEVPGAGPEDRARLERHRAVLQSAGRVADAVTRALQAAPGTVPAFPRLTPGIAVELRVATVDGQPALQVVHPGGAVVRAAITEFRFDQLLSAARQGSPDLFRGLEPRDCDDGCLVLAMVGDDMAGLGDRVRAADIPFLFDDVWPRILRLRQQRGEGPLDRIAAWQQLQDGWRKARDDGDLRQLDGMVAAFDSRVGREQLTSAELAELTTIREWLRQERRRRQLLAELQKAARVDDVAVAMRPDGLLDATVTLPAAALRSDASGGFELRDDLLVFGGGPRPWSELAAQRLQVSSGLEPVGGKYVLQADLVFPDSGLGARLYALDFRGIGVLITVLADDSIHASLVVGPLDRADVAQRAFRRALSDAGEAPPTAVVVPGAVHRLTVEVTGRSRAAVRVSFENVELCADTRELAPGVPPTVTIYPQQEFSVRQVRIRGEGL